MADNSSTDNGPRTFPTARCDQVAEHLAKYPATSSPINVSTRPLASEPAGTALKVAAPNHRRLRAGAVTCPAEARPTGSWAYALSDETREFRLWPLRFAHADAPTRPHIGPAWPMRTYHRTPISGGHSGPASGGALSGSAAMTTSRPGCARNAPRTHHHRATEHRGPARRVGRPHRPGESSFGFAVGLPGSAHRRTARRSRHRPHHRPRVHFFAMGP